MKNSFDYPQNVPVMQQQQCSETTCATCFENRGCMYDQYPVAATSRMEESHLENDVSPLSQMEIS